MATKEVEAVAVAMNDVAEVVAEVEEEEQCQRWLRGYD